MFRTTIWLDDRANVEDEASLIRSRALRAGVKERSAEQLRSEFIQVVGPLVDSGKLLRGQGSQLTVQRKLSGEGYTIDLRFGTVRKGLIARILDAFRAR